MSDISKLRELLGRVESADGPNFQLEKDINELVDVGYQLRLPNYTSSIDAAVALCERVLPEWSIPCIGQDDTKHWWAELREGHVTSYGKVAHGPADLKAKNPAIALCAAILRAKVTMLEKAMEHQEGK